MNILVPLTVALSLAIVGFAVTHFLLTIARRYEEDYLAKAGKELDEIHAMVDARVVWQAGIATAVLGFLAGYLLTGTWIPAIVLAAGGAVLPLGYLRFLKSSRKAKFHEQLPEVISQVRTAVACGYTLPMALQMAQRQLPAPASQELKVLLGHMRLGVPMGEALQRLTQRMPSEDLDLFVGAISMAERAGGQLNAILTNIETSVRDRLRMQRKLRTMTSRGRMEAWIITLGPFALGAGMWAINPALMKGFFEHPIGFPLAALAVLWMGCGYLVIKKILTPEF